MQGEIQVIQEYKNQKLLHSCLRYLFYNEEKPPDICGIVIYKPDALEMGIEEKIDNKIISAKLRIIDTSNKWLTKDDVLTIWPEIKNPKVSRTIAYMTSRPVIAKLIVGENVTHRLYKLKHLIRIEHPNDNPVVTVVHTTDDWYSLNSCLYLFFNNKKYPTENNNRKKVVILGAPCTGKTYITKKIKNTTLIHLDSLVWKEGFFSKRLNRYERMLLLNEFLTSEKNWIIEGAYIAGWIMPSLNEADVIVFLKENIFIRVYRLIKRMINRFFNAPKSLLKENILEIIIYTIFFESIYKKEIAFIKYLYERKIYFLHSKKAIEFLEIPPS